MTIPTTRLVKAAAVVLAAFALAAGASAQDDVDRCMDDCVAGEDACVESCPDGPEGDACVERCEDRADSCMEVCAPSD